MGNDVAANSMSAHVEPPIFVALLLAGLVFLPLLLVFCWPVCRGEVSILHFLNIFDCVMVLDVFSSNGPSSMLTSPSTCSVNCMVGVSEWGQLEGGVLKVGSVLSLYHHTSDLHYHYHHYIWPFLGVIWPEVFCGLPCQYVHLRFAF